VATFTILANGSEPLNYRWQKNSTNLNEVGHYSGVTTTTLTITSAVATDAASYRCVVTNAYGSTNTGLATLTVTNVNTPPSITQQPSNHSVFPGGTANFAILASGSDPLSYQWQKNQANLSDGGHCLGSTTAALTITGADNSDAASYRCVVTNSSGSTTSSPAALTVLFVTPSCIEIANSDFESGFALAGGGYIANNWTEWEAETGVVVGYDENAVTHGGGHSQRVRVWGVTNRTSGGVYQRVPAIGGQTYTVSVWTYAGDAATACSLGVDSAGGTNANSGVTWTLAHTNASWIQKSWTGTALSDFMTVYCRVESADSAKRNGYFDAAAPASRTVPPQLSVQRNGDILTLTWPACPGALLEYAESLTGPVHWVVIYVQGGSGDQRSMNFALTKGMAFFRLVLE
jgi:hypothetical protein